MYDELLELRNDYNKIRESIDSVYKDVIDTAMKKSRLAAGCEPLKCKGATC